MRFERLADDDCWQARPSFSGPAGAVALRLDPVLVEFDLIDHGRLVRLVIFDDAETTDGERVLGDAWHQLRHVADASTAVVEMTDTPLWEARYDLAAAAQLSEDVARLAKPKQADDTARGLAAAELADTLHRLDELAPSPAEDSLGQADDLLRQARLDGRPEIPRAAMAGTRLLAQRLDSWAPPEYTPLVKALGKPVEREAPPRRDYIRRLTTWSRPPSSAAVINHPFQDLGGSGDPSTRLNRAVNAARDALALEPREPAASAQRWRDSATSWLGLAEPGRAAIADDRAATGFERADDQDGARDARERARAVATPWALPYLEGRSGTPYRPLWSITEPDSLPPEPEDRDV